MFLVMIWDFYIMKGKFETVTISTRAAVSPLNNLDAP
jgi:hypothetical protein